MARNPPTLQDYIRTVLGRTLKDWHGANGFMAIAGYIAPLILGTLILSPPLRDFLGDIITVLIALIAIGLFIWFFFIATPFRLWRDLEIDVDGYKESLIPKIKVFYGDGSPACRKNVLHKRGQRDTGIQGLSIRLQVECETDAPLEDCAGFLTKIEFQTDAAAFREISIYEPNRLPWALEPNEFAPVYVHPGVPKYLGVCMTREDWPHFHFRSEVTSHIVPHEFAEHGIYRFTVRLVAKNSTTMEMPILIDWKGNWDEISVWREEST